MKLLILIAITLVFLLYDFDAVNAQEVIKIEPITGEKYERYAEHLRTSVKSVISAKVKLNPKSDYARLTDAEITKYPIFFVRIPQKYYAFEHKQRIFINLNMMRDDRFMCAILIHELFHAINFAGYDVRDTSDEKPVCVLDGHIVNNSIELTMTILDQLKTELQLVEKKRGL